MNDDAFQAFGVRKPLSHQEEAYHRELQRRSLDIIRVKNPDNVDFHFDWDRRWYIVPANGTADIMRYLAVTYCRNKAIDTINKTTDKLHAKDLEERRSKGMPDFQSKYEENKETYQSAKYPKTNDKELLTKLYSEYWVGLVSEYGKDTPPDQSEPSQGFDMTPLELKIIKEMENRRVDLTQEEPKPATEPVFNQKFDDVAEKKKDLAKKVTVE